MADNAPVAEVKKAVKSAFTIKFIVGTFVVVGLGLVALNYLGWTDNVLKPVDAIKRWNAARKAKAATT